MKTVGLFIFLIPLMLAADQQRDPQCVRECNDFYIRCLPKGDMGSRTARKVIRHCEKTLEHCLSTCPVKQ